MSLAQTGLERVQPARIGVRARCDSGNCFERALQIKRADAERAAERFQRDRLVSMRIDVAANIFDQLRVRIALVDLVRLAALARTESRPFRRFPRAKEDDVFAPRPLGWTGGPAIYARRHHRVEEHAVHGTIARGDGVPVIGAPEFSFFAIGHDDLGIYHCERLHKTILRGWGFENYPNLAVKRIGRGCTQINADTAALVAHRKVALKS